MPVVRQYESPQVQLQAAPNVPVSSEAPAEAFGVGVNQAIGNMGQSLGKVSDMASEYAAQKAKRENDAAAENAYTQYSMKVGELDAQFRNRQGAAAQGVTTEAVSKYGQIANEMAGTLPNDAARESFMRLYRHSLNQDLTSLSRFQAQQGIEYQNNVKKGVMGLEMDRAAKNWNDVDAVKSSVGVVEQMTRAQLEGQPKDIVELAVMNNRSKAFKSTVEKALQSDPISAQRIFDSVRGEMAADDQLALDKMLKVPFAEAQARNVVKALTSTTAGLPNNIAGSIQRQAMASGVDPTLALTVAKLENAKGDPNLKNPKSSARGIYQMLDATWYMNGGTPENRADVNKQIELGINNLKKTQSDLSSALGRQAQPWEIYLAHQQGTAGALALLKGGNSTAYESIRGFYNSDELARKAIADNGGDPNAPASQFAVTWRNKFLAAADKAVNSSMSLNERIDAANAIIGQDATPELRQAVMSAISSGYEQEKKLRQQNENDATEQIYKLFLQGKTLSDAPPDVLASIDAKSLYELQKTSQSNMKTNWYWHDQNMNKPQDEFLNIPIGEAAKNLSSADMDKFMKRRQEMKSGQFGEVNMTSSQSTLISNYAKEMGMIPTRNKPSAHELARYNAASETIHNEMQDFKRKNGRPMTDDEFRRSAARNFMKVSVDGGWFNRNVSGAEVNGREVKKIVDVPLDVRSQVEAVIRQNGKKVTDSLTLTLSGYWLNQDNDVNWAKKFNDTLKGAK